MQRGLSLKEKVVTKKVASEVCSIRHLCLVKTETNSQNCHNRENFCTREDNLRNSMVLFTSCRLPGKVLTNKIT